MKKVVFVGGKEFPAKTVGELLEKLPRDVRIVTGVGVGLEKWVAEQARELGFQVDVPPLYEEAFDYVEEYDHLKGPGTVGGKKKEGPKQLLGKKRRTVNSSRDLQVNTLFCEALHHTLVIVGSGGRPTAARDILKRANWPMEVIEL